MYDWRVMFVLIGAGRPDLALCPGCCLVKNGRPAIERAGHVQKGWRPLRHCPFGQNYGQPGDLGAPSLASSLTCTSFYFCMTWMPAYFMEKRHLSLGKMGLYTFFSFGGMALIATLAGLAADG